jgi:2'-hydroxyisoflavone reductase
MKLLVLGGTVFLGRHVVDVALERGHEVTLFNRGQHGAELYPQLEHLRGNRDPQQDNGLSALENAIKAGRTWDAVVDTSGYVPRIVRASAEVLQNAVQQYVFVSSISVYPSFPEVGMDESAALAELENPSTEDVGPNYGALKVACERALEAIMPGRVLHVRAGLIVGAHDQTDRFTYWPVRIARGGDVLAPGSPELITQWIDAVDLATWMLHAVERGMTGAFNVTGHPMHLGDLFDAIRKQTSSDARFSWLTESFLTEHQVPPWVGVNSLPLWVPSGDTAYMGFARIGIQKALQNGLQFRSLELTVQDTLAFANARSPDHAWRSGLLPEREQELLEAWWARG